MKVELHGDFFGIDIGGDIEHMLSLDDGLKLAIWIVELMPGRAISEVVHLRGAMEALAELKPRRRAGDAKHPYRCTYCHARSSKWRCPRCNRWCVRVPQATTGGA